VVNSDIAEGARASQGWDVLPERVYLGIEIELLRPVLQAGDESYAILGRPRRSGLHMLTTIPVKSDGLILS